MHSNHSDRPEGPILSRVMAVLASLFFALPTTALVWLASNRELALLATSDRYLGSGEFWGILSFFMCVALCFPALFPSLMGGVWRALISLSRW